MKPLESLFRHHFQAAAAFEGFAPGRVNLIGEHTDYHEGLVMPGAIARGIQMLGRGREDGVFRIRSTAFEEAHVFRLEEGMSESAGWGRRAEGIVRLLADELAGPLRGMDLLLDADLPLGGGLSSSAASMAAIALALGQVNGLSFERRALARSMQQAEHRFAGVKCGLMDQLAVLLGQPNCALKLDCRTLEIEPVAMPEAWAVLVLDTSVRHDLASSQYNQRQLECARALTKMQNYRPEIKTLRDATWGDLERLQGSLDALAFARARHVIAENERVEQAAQAIKQRDARRVGELFAASHLSLRDDYAVSCEALDTLAEAAWAAPGCIGARMTGGGFGGCTVNLVEEAQVAAFLEQVQHRFHAVFGRLAGVTQSRLGAGAWVRAR
ncbi:MAG: galactokinase [Myxococcota bacterium]|jgi:galactokinase|nr:galactokinase [Myxococcota bacterium]